MIKINNINDENLSININNISFSTVQENKSEIYTGEVYDLEVENEPVYETNIGFCHNGGGRRKGSCALYIQPYHGDIFDFLDLRKNNGKEEMRARDINIAIWCPNHFFRAVKNNEDYYLMDPNISKGLSDVYDETLDGGSFTDLYNKYVSEGKFVKKIAARDLWLAIIAAQIETGQPYILAKDTCNRCSNQINLGTIKSSNLCAEIIEYSDNNEIAVCFTEDTFILTNEGQKKIIDCDDKLVYSPFSSDMTNKYQPSFNKAKLINQGEKNVYELELSGMVKLKLTKNHPVLVVKSTRWPYNKENKNYKKVQVFEWKKVEDLVVGDRVHIDINDPLPHFSIDKKDFNKDYVAAGWILGDGWQRDKSFGVCFGPKEIKAAEYVLEIVNTWHDSVKTNSKYSRQRKVKKYVQKNGVINWASSKKSFIDFMMNTFGFNISYSKNKTIPNKIKLSTPIKQAAFLSGLFSADGSFDAKEKCASLSSASIILLEDVQLMLKHFGIHSRMIFGKDIRKEDKYQGHLSIQGNKNLERFNNFIGFEISEDKQDKLDNAILNKSKNNVFHNHAKVKKIKYIGKQNVYDLSVENTNHFIANGITVHNCNLASISLTSCVEGKKYKRTFNFDKLIEITETLTRNLNKIIDVEFYPVEKAKKSNFRHRPIGIGVQGLSDVFCLMRYQWGSEESRQLNKDIFETIYYAAMKTSCELAKRDGYYETFPGSPTSKGLFQFDLWNVKPSERYDWAKLKEEVIKYGLKNSLSVALMPTASCQIATNVIKTEQGSKSLYQIMEEQNIDWKKIEELDQPLSIPFENPVKISTMEGFHNSPGVHYNGYKDIYDIEFEDGKIYSYTANHLLLVNRNNEKIWIKVADLKENDDILTK
jgi:ribonucleoside-diphosphate reductase alpha chain